MASSPRKQTLKEIVIYGGKTNRINSGIGQLFHNIFIQKLSKRIIWSNFESYVKLAWMIWKGISGLWPRKASTQLAETYCLHQSIRSIHVFHRHVSLIVYFILRRQSVSKLTTCTIARQTSSISREYRKVRVTRNKMEERKYRWNVGGGWSMRDGGYGGQKIRSQRWPRPCEAGEMDSLKVGLGFEDRRLTLMPWRRRWEYPGPGRRRI